MKRAFKASIIAVLALLVVLAGCRSSNADTSKSETQRQFGVRMAKMNLWREAMFRFRRAVEMNPEDAMAHNNLAVALEANGDFDGAAKEYREALRLDRSNQHIQKNYSRFVEFTQRSKKRQDKKPAAATTAATGTAAIPAATGTTGSPAAGTAATPVTGTATAPAGGTATAPAAPAPVPPASQPASKPPASTAPASAPPPATTTSPGGSL